MRTRLIAVLVGVLLCVIGAVGTVGSILFGGMLVGQWAGAASVVFVMVAVAGILLAGRGRRRRA